MISALTYVHAGRARQGILGLIDAVDGDPQVAWSSVLAQLDAFVGFPAPVDNATPRDLRALGERVSGELGAIRRHCGAPAEVDTLLSATAAAWDLTTDDDIPLSPSLIPSTDPWPQELWLPSYVDPTRLGASAEDPEQALFSQACGALVSLFEGAGTDESLAQIYAGLLAELTDRAAATRPVAPVLAVRRSTLLVSALTAISQLSDVGIPVHVVDDWVDRLNLAGGREHADPRQPRNQRRTLLAETPVDTASHASADTERPWHPVHGGLAGLADVLLGQLTAEARGSDDLLGIGALAATEYERGRSWLARLHEGRATPPIGIADTLKRGELVALAADALIELQKFGIPTDAVLGCLREGRSIEEGVPR